MSWIRIQDSFARHNGVFYSYDTSSTPLGKGGMGTVYSGFCVRDDGSNACVPVAIKKVEGSNPELLKRARHEVSVQIDHPNLLRMYAFIDNEEMDSKTGLCHTGHYIIMDLVEGVDLDSLIQGHTTNRSGLEVPYAKTLYELFRNHRTEFVKTVMTGVLQGVGAMHECGFVHRDLDPSNIMITNDGLIKVIDFGVSKKYDISADVVEGHTMVGSFIGKSAYAAPEVVVGDIDNHNPTTDIYALGIVMYQLFTGVLPFEGGDTEVRRMHIEKALPLVNISDKKLRKIVEKSTCKEQASRYQSVNEILADFDKFPSHSPKGDSSTKAWPAVIIISIFGIVGFIIGWFIVML